VRAFEVVAAASSNNNLSWLIINDNNTYGKLDISQPYDMLISVNIVGLKSTPKTPYKGQIVFTINDNQLLTLPVQLQISDATPEMVFSPDPIIAQKGPGNTCKPSVTLTLINLGTVAISWSVILMLTSKTISSLSTMSSFWSQVFYCLPVLYCHLVNQVIL